MELIRKINELQIFSLKDLSNCGISSQALLKRMQSYIKKGVVSKVRRDLYVSLNLSSGLPIADRFQIGCSISERSYIAYHSALEYYGVSNQQFYTLFVGCDVPFKTFSFNGIQYEACISQVTEEIISPRFNSKVRVTSLERTVIDCIDKIDKAGGLEELVQSFSLLPHLDEQKLIRLLDVYGKGVLYKKAGYILQSFSENTGLSPHFFDICRKYNLKGRRSLFGDNPDYVYNKEWELMVPENLTEYLEQGNYERV